MEDGKAHSLRALKSQLIARFRLSDDDLAQMLPSGRRPGRQMPSVKERRTTSRNPGRLTGRPDVQAVVGAIARKGRQGPVCKHLRLH